MHTRQPLVAYTDGFRGLPRVTVIQDGDVTSVAAEMDTFGGTIHAVGSARRHPRDVPDSDIGVALATARAVRALADLIEEGAWDAIQVHEDLKRTRQWRDAVFASLA